MLRKVSSNQVIVWQPVCMKLARKYTGVGRSEYDDNYQEAMIACWLAMAHGYRPTPAFIENRIKNWVNRCRKRGLTGDEE